MNINDNQDGPDQDHEKNDSEIITIYISEEDLSAYRRLDQFLVEKVERLSRNEFRALFDQGKVTSSTETLTLKKMPKNECEVSIEFPEIKECPLLPQNIPLAILYEDKDLVIIDKPEGLVVHPAPGHPDNTLVNAILYHCDDIQGVGDEKRPGIVHRLDKGTSGVMVVAKNTLTHRALVEMFSKHELERRYNAYTVAKEVPVGGTLKSLYGRHPTHRLKMSTRNKNNTKQAITHYKVLKKKERVHQIECKLETGRTHQIRVHLSELLNTTIIGDALYGNIGNQKMLLPKELLDISFDAPYLHAKTLEFIHPTTKKYLQFETSEPPRFDAIKKYLGV